MPLLKKIATHSFLILFTLTMGWIALAALVGISQPLGNVLLVAFILCAFFLTLYRVILTRTNTLAPRHMRWLVGGLFAVFIAFATAMGCLTMTYPVSDLEVLCNAVSAWVAQGHILEYSYYFTVCANTLGNTMLLYAIFKPLSYFGLCMGDDMAECIAIFCNVLLMALAVFLVYRISTRMLKTNAQQLLFLLLSLSFAPFYLWAHRYYSDTLSMPFVPLAIWLYLRASESKHMPHRILYGVLTGACLWVGYFIKGSALIALPALLIFALFTQDWKRQIQFCVPMLLALVLCVAGWEQYRHHNDWIDYSNEARDKYPTTMWLLYGAHGDGNYADEDVKYLMTFDNYQDRADAAKARLADYYSAYTPASYLEFLTTKFTATWSDAKYSADNYIVASRHGNWTHYFLMEGMPYYALTGYYCNGWHVAFLGMLLLGTLVRLWRVLPWGTNKNAPCGAVHSAWDMGLLARICLFGLIVFLCFWETKPRYLLSFAPLFPLFFAEGLLVIDTWVPKLRYKLA